MMFEWCLLAICFLMLGAAYGCIRLARVIHYWKGEGRKMETDKKYRTPKTPWSRRLVRSLLGRLAAAWYLGRKRQIGKLPKKLKKGRYIYVCNHQTEADAIMVAWLMGLRKVRYFIAFNQARGVRAAGVAYSGGIPVDFFDEVGSAAPPVNEEQPNRPSVGRRLLEAVQTAVALLKEEPDSDFFIFPQGRLVRDNKLVLSDFHDGAVRLSRSLEEPIFFVPIGVHYDHNPSHRSLLCKFLNLIGFKSYGKFYKTVNAQTVAAIGEPIAAADLPKEKKQATAILFGKVKELSDAAAAACGNATVPVAANVTATVTEGPKA